MKINIKSNKKQKEDIATYYNMIGCLLKKINEAGLHMSWIDMREDRKPLKKGLELSVEIIAYSLEDYDELTRLFIKVHKKEAMDIVQNVLQEYSDKYHHLQTADITPTYP